MKKVDIAVLGAGPAGISAGIYALRAGANVVVFDNGNSALKNAKTIENYYGIPSISGEKLLKSGIEQFEKLGGDCVRCEVLQIKNNFDEHTYTISTTVGDYLSTAVILAIGSGKKKTIDALEPFEGTNVSYCAICDGFFFAGKDVAVIGDGQFARAEAEELSKNAKTVYLVSKMREKIAKLSKNIVLLQKNIVSFEGNGLVERIVFDDKTSVNVDGVFVALGTLSSFEIAKQLGILCNSDCIDVDKNFMTNVAGVFAAGDCIKGLRQVSKAVGDGAQAGIEAVRYCKMLEEDE